MKMVVDLREDVELKPGHRAAHVRFPGAGDLRVPVRARAADGLARHLRAVVVPQPGAHGVPLSAALDDASVPVALARGRHAAVVGRQVAAGVRPPRRAASHGRRLRAHRRRVRQHERAHRIGRRRSVDDGRAAGGGGDRAGAAGDAVHEGEPRSDLRRATPRQLARPGAADCRGRARRFRARRAVGTGRHGPRRPDEWRPAPARPAARRAARRRSTSTSPAAFRPTRSRASAIESLADGTSDARRVHGPHAAGRRFRTTGRCS